MSATIHRLDPSRPALNFRERTLRLNQHETVYVDELLQLTYEHVRANAPDALLNEHTLRRAMAACIEPAVDSLHERIRTEIGPFIEKALK